MSGFNGTKVRQLRELKNWTQGDLAERAGISRSYLSELESGTRNDPAASYLKKLADALTVPLDFLFDDSNKLPIQHLADIFPNHITTFLQQPDCLPYLELTVKARECQVTPEELAQLIDILGRKAVESRK